MVWTPPQAKRIRAILLVSPNTDSMSLAAHKAVRAAAAKHDMGAVYLRFCPHLELMEKIDANSRQAVLDANRKVLQAILDKVAERTGIVEYRHAPWVPLGKSSCGRFPFNLAWFYPDRVVAGITWHGEVPHWPTAEWARLKGQTIPYINVNGETEWGGTWYRHVRPGLLNYRAHEGWLPHQVVSWGVGHGNYPDETSGRNDPAPRMMRATVWDYMALWLDKVLELRLPKDGYPTAGPVKLRQVDDGVGHCIDPRAPEELLQLPYKPLERDGDRYKFDPYKSRSPGPGEPAPENPKGLKASQLIHKTADMPAAERKKMLWVPDREVAEAWFKLHAVKGQKFDVP
jgi:hypothetical protein